MTSSVSVVHSPHKNNNNVLQQQNNIRSSDMREIIILRKAPHILPQPNDYNKEDILLANTARKKNTLGNKDIRTAPQPVAVARRNARERNRVKQVNNGFNNLRQHIPNFIAQAFESNSRGGNKKVSKVETLRMAVEYIRSLEDLLAEDGGCEPPAPSSSHNFHDMLSPSADEDDLSSTNPSPPPDAQFTYQIIYDDSENLEPLNILSDPSLMMDAELEFQGAQDLSLLNNLHHHHHHLNRNSDSLSPGLYSEQSLSPDGDSEEHFGRGVLIKREDLGGDIPVISLKTEHELPNQHIKSNVIDVMQWWEQQQPPHDSLS